MSQGTKNTLLGLAIAAAVIGVALTPTLLHALDSGEQRVPASALRGDFHGSSRNLVVEGRLSIPHRVEIIVRDKNGRTKSRRTYLPLVPEGWTPAQPVQVVYSVRAWPGYGLDEEASRPEHKGVLRNIWWEGLSGRVRTELERQGVRIAEDAVLIEAL